MVADAAAVTVWVPGKDVWDSAGKSITGRESKVKDLGLMESSSQGMCLAQRDSRCLVLLSMNKENPKQIISVISVPDAGGPPVNLLTIQYRARLVHAE